MREKKTIYKGNKNILKYYKKLVNLAKNNSSIGVSNEWILDNYYIINGTVKNLILHFNNKKFNLISDKTKLYNIVFEIMNTNKFQFNINIFYYKLNKYQEEEKYYFSYLEIEYMKSLIDLILLEKLSDLTCLFNYKLNQKLKLDHAFKNMKNKKNSFKFSNFIKLNNKDCSNLFLLEELVHELFKIEEDSFEFISELNRILSKNNLELKDIIKEEQQKSIDESVMVMNIFNSLKANGSMSLEKLYQNVSFYEKELMNEKIGVYKELTKETKEEYRRIVYKLSKGKDEYEYIKKLVSKADEEKTHIGEFLYKKVNKKPRTYIYILFIFIISAIISIIISKRIGIFGALLVLIPVIGFVVDILTQILIMFIKPTSLPSLKVGGIIKESSSTMVVIPTIVKDVSKLKRMFDNLETYYLSNKAKNLYFTLLADVSSEDVKDIEMDKTIIEEGIEIINSLNKKYGEIFHFVYRNRFYAESEGKYLGYERKRGALLHFNDLILGNLSEAEKESYFKYNSFNGFEKTIKYIIVLDADTKLVLNSALKLIGIMMHPLNQPVLSEDGRSVIDGYAIVQPKVSIDVEVTDKSNYSQLFAGLGGLDIYSQTQFDLYQDVFNEGSFVGKGIYDLAVFQKVLKDTFPENLILSHDLLEGNYLRCGFASNVEVYDDFPSRYLNDSIRHHRWTRGDWQILGWLRKKVKDKNGLIRKNPISLIGKWKIFDNLRRSLKAPSLLLFLWYGFVFNSEDITTYIAILSIIISFPIIFYMLSLIKQQKYNWFIKYYMNLIRGFLAILNKVAIEIVLIPYEAYLYVDAISRSLYRMLFSKKKLLDWITSEEVEKISKNDIKSYFKAFSKSYFIIITIIITNILFNDGVMLELLTFSIIWSFAPLLMYLLSKDTQVNDFKTINMEEDFYELSLKTWKFFDENLTKENNYLIPDNYQLNRKQKADNRTSPTNIGFSLIAIVCAYELKFITLEYAIESINNIIKTVEKMEKWNGHLYNWYNISTTKKIVPHFVSTVDSGNFVSSLYVIKGFLEYTKQNKSLIFRIDKLIKNTNFSLLYDYNSNVFAVGYDTNLDTITNYNYDKFVSENRLTSYVAIAKGDVNYKHWFHLEKSLTKYKNKKGMLSWNGTMFEYYMPLIFMKSYNYTLMDESYDFSHFVQKDYIKRIDKTLPWGISESGYNELDDSQNYKYYAFGIPNLKFNNSPSREIVISPYSSIMAISKYSKSVYNNYKKFKNMGMIGDYGLYEAYDVLDSEIVKTYYSHHQGMILSSITNFLNNNVIQEYFHTDKNIKSIEILLKEKSQVKSFIDTNMERYRKFNYDKKDWDLFYRYIDKPSEKKEIGMLSNGMFTTILDDKGRGYTKYKNLQINRYRNVDDNYGTFLYIKDIDKKEIWTNTYEPFLKEPDRYNVTFEPGTIKFIREDNKITTKTEVIITKEHNAEIRKVTFNNGSNKTVHLDVSSYSELIMCRNEEDVAHRAFNGITISCELDESKKALIYKRRSKTKDNTEYFVVNRILNIDEFEFENSRLNFIGRNNDIFNPTSVVDNEKHSSDLNALIDPIMSIRGKISLKPKTNKTIYLLTGFGKSKEQVIDIVDSYGIDNMNATFKESKMFGEIIDIRSDFSSGEVEVFNKILNLVYTPSIYEKIESVDRVFSKNDIWKYGISLNFPVITLVVENLQGLSSLKNILNAYAYYKSRSIYIDVVIINKDIENSNILKTFFDNTIYLINNTNYFYNDFGGAYFIESNSDYEDKLFGVASNVMFYSSDIVSNRDILNVINKKLKSYEVNKNKMSLIQNEYKKTGDFNNLNEYEINTINTPMPWSNILTNGEFGAVITNNMSGFTYGYNSREFKISAWHNDSVKDQRSENIFINKEELSINSSTHGFGYSRFNTNTKDYFINTNVFVGTDNVKVYDITIKNKSGTIKHLEVEFSLLAVLGDAVEYNYKFIKSNYIESDNALILKNILSNNFSDKEVFITSTLNISKCKYDNIYKSIFVEFDLEDEKRFAFIVGSSSENDVLIRKYNNINNLDIELDSVKNYWNTKLNKIKVNTDDISFNNVMNGWYLYQVYASRLMARTGLYQVGGAFGFRDQLQDILSIIQIDEDFAREQILRNAAHQFKTGEVLHWWHEDLKFGARTRFSDDYLWLIYVVDEYLKITEDYKILDEMVPYVQSEELKPTENEMGVNFRYEGEGTLLEHMIKSLELSLLRFGKHNIPLIGSGDWNDGMNKIGENGKGESVWVGMFLYDLIHKMCNILSKTSEKDRIDYYINRANSLKDAINTTCWDNEWYLRGFFDDGTKVGSSENEECKIDLLVQTWSILTDIIPKNKIPGLISFIENNLIDRKSNIIKLLTPPFTGIEKNPGYISDYLSGLRENGGQYTHAALWYVKALIKLGYIDKAYEYFSMINPINRTLNEEMINTYKVEPYVIAADIYSNPSHNGRGGWTWYTGSASWAYKIGIEEILGIKKLGSKLIIDPKIYSKWKNCNIKYKYKDTIYEIQIIKETVEANKVKCIILDEIEQDNNNIPLKNDRKEHFVRVIVGGIR